MLKGLLKLGFQKKGKRRILHLLQAGITVNFKEAIAKKS
jgi:hypothetical protein